MSFIFKIIDSLLNVNLVQSLIDLFNNVPSDSSQGKSRELKSGAPFISDFSSFLRVAIGNYPVKPREKNVMQWHISKKIIINRLDISIDYIRVEPENKKKSSAEAVDFYLQFSSHGKKYFVIHPAEHISLLDMNEIYNGVREFQVAFTEKDIGTPLPGKKYGWCISLCGLLDGKNVFREFFEFEMAE